MATASGLRFMDSGSWVQGLLPGVNGVDFEIARVDFEITRATAHAPRSSVWSATASYLASSLRMSSPDFASNACSPHCLHETYFGRIFIFHNLFFTCQARYTHARLAPRLLYASALGGRGGEAKGKTLKRVEKVLRISCGGSLPLSSSRVASP